MWALLVTGALCCALQSVNGADLTIIPDRSLNGDKLNGPTLRMFVASADSHLRINFTAPFFEGDLADNRVHLFLAASDSRITEIEFTPSSSTLRLYWAPFNVLRTVSAEEDPATFTASSDVSSDRASWAGAATVHTDLLPPRISRYNAALVHPVKAGGSALQYDTLYSITNYAVALPDLMVLPRYKEIGPRFLFSNDGGYSRKWQTEH